MAEFADGLTNEEIEEFSYMRCLDTDSDYLMEHETSSDEDLLWCPFGANSHPIEIDDRA